MIWFNSEEGHRSLCPEYRECTVDVRWFVVFSYTIRDTEESRLVTIRFRKLTSHILNLASFKLRLLPKKDSCT